MTEHEMQAKIATLLNMLTSQPKPKTPAEVQMAQAMIIGAELLGELFIDIKRAANALENIG